MKKDTKKLITCIAIPIATGAVSGFFTRNGMKVFTKLNKTPLSPPGWLFPVVWTILFVMMGIASYMIAGKKKSQDSRYIPDELRKYATLGNITIEQEADNRLPGYALISNSIRALICCHSPATRFAQTAAR